MRTPILLASLLLIAACGGSGYSTSPGNNPTTTPQVTTSVKIEGIAFGPSAIQVSPSAVVTWTNADNINHNVTFSSAAIGATTNFATGTKTLTMPAAAGTYAYHCSIHPSMNGTVEVK